MRESLRRWIADADTRQSMTDFLIDSNVQQLEYLQGRSVDLYYSLAGELFARLRNGATEDQSWGTLGNGLASVSRDLRGQTRADALFFSAVAFYRGGFPASALLTMRDTSPEHWMTETQRACYELLTRSPTPATASVRSLVQAVRVGAQTDIAQNAILAQREAQEALQSGPDEWVARHLYAALLYQFQSTNLRAVLPDGSNPRWDPLVASFLDRTPAVWEFFPSQVAAIATGLLTSTDSYSMQMPTGSGKTALTETLLFNHLVDTEGERAVLLVPFRALARELRHSVGRRLSSMGLRCRTIYGGTIPTREEEGEIDNVRVIIATPEALTGLLGSHPEVVESISLVVCDEGHLLDGGARGIGLELLLARFRARVPAPRIIFLSAIVPNVEEINSWLGGTDSTVVRSAYQPAPPEYAVLRPNGSGVRLEVGLELQGYSTTVPAHTLPNFLDADDFRYINPLSGRRNVYSFNTHKTRAIAAARKALPVGTVAVFATAKSGPQGVYSLAEELINQLAANIPLPNPIQYSVHRQPIDHAIEYLASEYGSDWVGTRALQSGAAVHHGDLPQETRDVLEDLLSTGRIAMVICTSTLAEGVNLPIRTMVLYSVTRPDNRGRPTPMLARDIKNLVGRAGRAGSSTRGLVICANPDNWPLIRPVTEGAPGERVEGALLDLLRRLEGALARGDEPLSNSALEDTPPLLPLIDGIDTSLIELIHDELGNDEFVRIAESIASSTFAAMRASAAQRELLGRVFRLRAARMLAMRSSGMLAWAQETGARPRLLDSVVASLFPRFDRWGLVESPLDDDMLTAVLEWAWEQPGFSTAAEKAFEKSGVEDIRAVLHRIVKGWISGDSFLGISANTGLRVQPLLRVHASIVAYELMTLVEQAMALLQRYTSSEGIELGAGALVLPDSLRHGVSTAEARFLMASGVRHRRAAVSLGDSIAETGDSNPFTTPRDLARSLLEDSETWTARLGRLVYFRTVVDVSSAPASE